MEDPILTGSIALRLAGVAYSLVLLYQVGDRRFGFLTLMLSLMATRQLWTMGVSSGGLSEFPGLVVSVLAILTVYYLSQFVEQEAQTKRMLSAANDRLRSFRKAIEHAGHAIFLTERDGTITYANPAMEIVTGYEPERVVGENPSLWSSGRHDDKFYAEMWETILGGDVWEGELVNERKDGEEVWVDMTIAPIEGDEGEVEQFVAVDTDVTERKRRKLRIKKQNERLAALNHTNEVLRDVNQHLVEASSRDEIEAGVCEEFAAADPNSFATVVTRNLVNDSLAVRTKAGIGAAALGEFLNALDREAENPVLAAFEDGEVAIVDDVMSEPGGVVDVASCKTVVAIPILYGSATYGVLVVGVGSNALADIDIPVLSELGETVGHAVNAVASKQALLAEQVTELEVKVGDSSCVAGYLSERLDCAVDLEWLTTEGDGSLVAYYLVASGDVDELTACIDDLSNFSDAKAVNNGDDECLVRVVMDEQTVAATFADQGVLLTDETAVDGEATCTAILPRDGDIRVVMDALNEAHGDVELLAKRDRERLAQTIQEVQSEVVNRFTDRQYEALRTAYIGGFFEWPRQNTGEEVAAMLDISQSTFLQHLRASERKLLDVLFE